MPEMHHELGELRSLLRCTARTRLQCKLHATASRRQCFAFAVQSGSDPKLGPDEDYPAWLWELEKPEPQLSELEKKGPQNMELQEARPGREPRSWRRVACSLHDCYFFNSCAVLRYAGAAMD